MKRGLALIVVVGILGVLAVLAAAFVAMAQLERRASEQRVNGARAYLLARSGIEDALARLDLGQDPAYGGEDWDNSGTLNGFEGTAEVHQRGTLNVEDCPLRHALRPSFFVRAPADLGADGLPAPRRATVDGRPRGYSGALAGDYAAPGNTYALKAAVEGSEGHGFYINGGDPSVHSVPTAVFDLTGTTAITDYNLNLRRMLGILARAIQEEAVGAAGGLFNGSSVGDVQGVAGALILTESDGWALIDARPSTGWKDWEQVRDLAWGGLPVVSDLKLAALKPYLTLHAYVDKKVIAPHVAPSILNPNGQWYNTATLQHEPTKAYHSWGEYKLDPDRRETKQGLRAPDFERINGKLVGRAPIDFSWARRKRPALIALLGNLKGLYLDEIFATSIRYRDAIGRLQAVEITLAWNSSPDICHKVADRILTSTSELITWQQWNDFCDALPDDDFISTSTEDYLKEKAIQTGVNPFGKLNWDTPAKQRQRQAVRDLLKANFNSNSNLNKFSPNFSMWKSVDKSDLLAYSTEFSLLPVSHGHQEVSGIGRVVDRGGRLLASRVLKALLAGPPPVRLTTQKEFVSEDLGALDIAGDETGYRLPGQAGAPFITLGQGSGKTWGHTLPGLGGSGASLQTYPEPVVNDGSYPAVTLSINPADYDGTIQLATVETAQDSTGFYGATGTTDLATAPPTGAPYRKMMMLARYTGHFDLDVSAALPDGGPEPSPDPNLHVTPRQNHPDFHQVTSNCEGDPGKWITAYPYYQSARQRDLGPPNLEALRNSLLHATKPNTLYPDGCYSEENRAPEYLDKGNADGYHGVMSFWIKANHLPPVSSAFKDYPRGHPILKWTNFLASTNPASDGTPQFFCWGDSDFSLAAFPLVCQFEIGHSAAQKNQEHRFRVGRFLIPHRWELLTCRWDSRAPTKNDTMEMLLNAGRAGGTPSQRGNQDDYDSNTGNTPALASDITVDDLSVWDGTQWIKGPHRLPLGGRGHPEWENSVTSYYGSSADATFDEFALYDFGGAGPGGTLPVDYANTTKASPEVLAAARYPEGRYYKESAYGSLGVSDNTAGEWFSAPIHLGAVRIRGLAWTQIVPPELRPEGAISFELVDETGTAYALDLGGNQLLTNPAFSPVNRELRGAFRLHAVFQPNLADPINTPILDPLTLDDVTVYYEPLGGARVVAYETAPDE